MRTAFRRRNIIDVTEHIFGITVSHLNGKLDENASVVPLIIDGLVHCRLVLVEILYEIG